MNFSRKLLAGALLAVLPLGSALACTTSAWTAATGAPVADDPDTNAATNNNPDGGAVKRYSGNCGLQPAPAGSSFVTNDTPGTEGIYRMRIYGFTGATAGTPVLMRATSADGGTGTEIFSVSYNPAGGSFTFTANGTTVPAVTGVVASKWYSIEVLHQNGQPLSVTVLGAQGAVNDTAPTVVASVGNVAGTVGSAQVGITNAGAVTGPVFEDEFDSTRSAATPIGRLCRGDANGNGNAAVGDVDLNALDAGAIIAERFGQSIAPGQPDSNEDGTVNALDAGLVIAMRFAGKKCN